MEPQQIIIAISMVIIAVISWHATMRQHRHSDGD
jgi:hypothetical protein